ncbi:MAG TPA: ShlB/FhaC/HecB family hemolysin secretion/activation protein [Burkholderiales bacterium]|nr:ShlB/FhaC/HecB family hemolysin secretion/activation protein [Burkholderiales bacterium]
MKAIPRRHRLSHGWIGLAFAGLAAPAAAQVVVPPAADPGAIQQRQIEEERRRRQEEELRRPRIEKPLDTDALKPPPAAPAAPEVRFLVREIEFSKSEILAREELDALAAPYRGRTVPLAELQRLVEQVNDLYRRKGVVTAQAILPPQDLTEGIVRIRLIEGRIGKISVQGNDTTSASYLAALLSRQPGELVDLPALERDLKRFNRTHDAQLRAELKPGAAVGETDVTLFLAEPPRHELRLSGDNSGSAQTGETRAGIAYRNRSLFGRRDDLALSFTRAEGHEGYSAAYGLPVGTLGTRLQLAYYDDRTKIKRGALAALNLSGESTAIVASLRHPLAIADAYQVDGVLGTKKRDSLTRIETVLLQDTETRDVNFALEAQLADRSGYWLASAAGLRVTSRPLAQPERSFRIWRGSLRRSHHFSGGYAAFASLLWQHTRDDVLPSSEQFLIGGEGTVRGYQTGLLSGDRGVTLNLELHHPLPLAEGQGAPQASGFFFLDHGWVRPFRPAGDPRDDKDSITGAGWGVNLAFGKRASLRATYGKPLRSRPEEPRNDRVTFQFVLNLL